MPSDDVAGGREPSLLAEFAPCRDFALTEHLVVAASPGETYAVVAQLRGADLRSPVLRVLTWARGLPVRLRPDETAPAFEEILLGARWVLLGERPCQEIVLGAAGRFWTPRMRWDVVVPHEFARYDRPRSGTIALALSILPFDREQTLLTLDTRVTVHDPVARRWAELYWQAIKPTARLVARQVLHAVNDEATGRHRSARN
ncbi:hypothetical protein LWP59_20680 [Amycolatopsis acidiphila]|uniref:DUF2867 domain-containing protein n=1 Tax=Amycolatopsis acidiphila TaxID=715473 RepID=A0A558A2Y8_9PSEU|nr:hypothetical protein [Amycolatopsis acidiphila]TVT18627.1 hypothetical protein FNH06_27190 [Amycolatopsis acidiphila]UIJ56608.1 hypothetical protein LWP59_20680 [Amycolatopsis acidiphila]GHG66404.1 hypothetical protein GCM10017788_24280 [Amycolatopsis acidiphila]